MRGNIIGYVRKVQLPFALYVILAVFVVMVLANFVTIPPLELTDFVVDMDQEIIIYSSLNHRFYIYSPDNKLRKVITRSETKGLPVLAVDESNNIYWENGGYVFIYGLDGKEELAASVDYPVPSNWRLDRDGKLIHFDKPETGEWLTGQAGLRRIARLGDILFMEEKEDEQRRQAFKSHNYRQEYFIDDKGNRYECDSWLDGIRVYNDKGELVNRLRPPFYVRPFICPYPGWYLFMLGLLVLAVSEFAVNRLEKKRTNRREGM